MRDPFEEFDRMSNKMMSEFGMPKMDISNYLFLLITLIVMPFGGRDLFANDPFFNDRGFGRIDEMMSKMKHEMKAVMNMPMR